LVSTTTRRLSRLIPRAARTFGHDQYLFAPRPHDPGLSLSLSLAILTILTLLAVLPFLPFLTFLPLLPLPLLRLTLTLLTLAPTRTLAKLQHSRHALFARLTLLPHHLAQFFETLTKLFLFLVRHLLLLHAVDVFRRLLEVFRRCAHFFQKVFRRFGQRAIEPIELPARTLLTFRFTIEPFEFTLLFLQEFFLGFILWPSVRVVFFLLLF
jgi:hypothetical protein